MKGFLLDENVPRRLMFTPSLPVISSSTLGSSLSDTTIWNHAREHELVIITKDTDFSHRIMLSAAPPWIVHLRFGNLSLEQYHALLKKMWPHIESQLPACKLICVYQDRVESFRE